MIGGWREILMDCGTPWYNERRKSIKSTFIDMPWFGSCWRSGSEQPTTQNSMKRLLDSGQREWRCSVGELAKLFFCFCVALFFACSPTLLPFDFFYACVFSLLGMSFGFLLFYGFLIFFNGLLFLFFSPPSSVQPRLFLYFPAKK
jgi:hypothetical protein